MKQLLRLIKGEFKRLICYKILHISLLVSALWVVIILLLNKDDVVGIVPSLILMDSAMMSIILLASSYFFEKQENTIKTLLVTPVETWQILLAKVISVATLGLSSGIIVVLTLGIGFGLWVQWALLLMYIVLIVTSHTAIGMLITMYSKDFSTMLTNYMLFAIVTIIPTFLLGFGVIPENWELFMLVSPTQGADVLIGSIFTEGEPVKIAISIGYLFLLSILLYPLVVYPQYKRIILEG